MTLADFLMFIALAPDDICRAADLASAVPIMARDAFTVWDLPEGGHLITERRDGAECAHVLYWWGF